MSERVTDAQVVIRLDPQWRERFDSLADVARAVLKRDVSRAMVVRAAVRAWVVTNEGVDPGKLVEPFSSVGLTVPFANLSIQFLVAIMFAGKTISAFSATSVCISNRFG